MIHINLEHFPKGAYKKLYSKNTSPYRIMKKINSNAYLLKLLDDMGISNMFNVEDFTLYKGHYDDSFQDEVLI